VLQLPRPRNGQAGVVRLERHYETEYGMPSTHAMNSVAMPWTMVYLAWGRFTGNWGLALGAAVAWTLACTLSRLYMGVHSPADLITGLGLGGALLALHVAYGAAIDAWVLQSELVPILVPFVAAIVMFWYPRPATPRWVSTPGDTAIIVGVATGVSLAVNALSYVHTPAAASTFNGPRTWSEVAWTVPHMLVGFPILALTRLAVKWVMTTSLLFVLGETYDTSGSPMSDSRHADEGDADAAAAPVAQGPPSPSCAPAAAGVGSSVRSGGTTPPVSSGSGSGSGAGVRRRRVEVAYDGTSTADVNSKRPTIEVDTLPAATPLTSSSTRASGASGAAPQVLASPSAPASGVVPPGGVRVPPNKRYEIELPTKLATYACVGVNAVFLVPWLFQRLGWKDYGI
jgi:hypothetical protein